ncbi:MAG: hypothetical protein EZS28_055991, partial [Streblomastix strix]
TSQHPFFQSLSECGGIKKIFELFQKNLNSYTKDYSALIIGFVYRAQVITDQLMKKEIISYLKNLLNDTDDWKKKISMSALKYLSQNAGNHSEILKDDFISNTEQFLSNDSPRTISLINILKILIIDGSDQTR